MAVVKPFRALRYDEAVAGPLETLVAPPYDVITPEQREELRARSPHNVVRLTLPDSEDEAGRDLEEWRAQGALVEEPPAVWALEQAYVGPDGIARRRFGIVASLEVEPYETGTVLPHERTHRGPKEGRLRLLRATRVQLEPIFLLYDGPAPVERPDREPDLEVEGAKLWRIDDPSIVRAFDDKQLLIADGHHRYETAVAFHEEEGTPASAQMMVVLVSTSDPGLEIFPTHRLFAEPKQLDERDERRRGGDRGDAGRLPGRPRPRGHPRRPVRRHASATRGSRTQRTPRRPSGASATARRPSRICCGRRASRTSSPTHAAAKCCRKRQRTSSRS